jgi:hypothetical protein
MTNCIRNDLTPEKKKWMVIDENQRIRYPFAVRMVDDGTFEAFDDVSFSHDTFERSSII